MCPDVPGTRLNVCVPKIWCVESVYPCVCYHVIGAVACGVTDSSSLLVDPDESETAVSIEIFSRRHTHTHTFPVYKRDSGEHIALRTRPTLLPAITGLHTIFAELF